MPVGSISDAEDVLQEASVRWSTQSVAANSTRAFLTTVVTRLSLDLLKSARVRRESYVGPWLPEPLIATWAETPGVTQSPEDRLALTESLSLAFLVLLERLSPLERGAFLLREVFDHDYVDVARILGLSEAACRQLVARARSHIDDGRPRFGASEQEQRRLLGAFLSACASGDAAALGRMLASNVVARSDGGGKVTAALQPIVGADRVARFLIGISAKISLDVSTEIARVNGDLGLLVRVAGVLRAVIAVHLSAGSSGSIDEVFLVMNPDKLTPKGHHHSG